MKIARRVTVLVFICAGIFWAVGKVHTMRLDTTAPVIYADSDEIHVQAGCPEEELKTGLTAADPEDGDITGEIIVGTISPFTEKGVSRVEYIVFDRNNNVGRYERTVCFDGYTSPKFELTKPLVYKKNSDIVISDRLYAVDVLAGDISDKVRYASADAVSYEAGTYDLEVEVKNPYGDVVQEKLLLNVVPYDTETEYIRLSSYLIYVSKGSTVYPADYIEKVVDTEGHELGAGQVTIVSEVDLNVQGSGQYRYELRNENNEIIYVTYLAVIVTE